MQQESKNANNGKTGEEYIGEYIQRAKLAQAEFEKKSQEEVDAGVMAIAKAIYDHAEELAEMAVEESGMGNVPDKTAKNQSKASVIWNHLKGKKSRGVLERNQETGITKIAKPMGIVAAITPCTNPIVTPMSNAMFALKCGNAIIITPHHHAIRSSTKAVEYMNEALKKLDLPRNLIQILDWQSRENTRNLMTRCDVVIATGGMSMVKAAYSSGRPALGVGAGNVQCILDRNIDYRAAVSKLVAGRAFDYGIICSGEQSAILPREDMGQIMRCFEEEGCLVIRDDVTRDSLRQALFPEGEMNRHAIGQSPQRIGELAGFFVPEACRVLVVEGQGFGDAELFTKEKMCPVLVVHGYDDFKEGVEIAKANLEVEGKGHSISIHSNNRHNIQYAALHLSVSRFLVNQACSFSAGGSFFNGLNPTNTLGCGTWGNNSISENLTYTHLMNVSQIADFMPDNHVPTQEELWQLEPLTNRG
jgi:succinate-semialdehyde dehydrogenase